MGNDKAANEEQGLLELMDQASHAINRVRQNELRAIGLSLTRANVLELVRSAKEPLTPAKISRSLFREPHSVAGLLRRMENEGLIRRVKNLERKNWVRVEITEKGEKAYQRSIKGKVLQDIISSLPAKERDYLRAGLASLLDKAIARLGEQLGREHLMKRLGVYDI